MAPGDGRRRLGVFVGHLLGSEENRVAAASGAGVLSSEAVFFNQGSDKALEASYDFIVIGGGSAGCVVASRLSEDPSVSVLLVEAGGSQQTIHVRCPMLVAGLQNSARDWAFRTVPQPHTDGRVSHWPRGKMLGGCSSINYMLYVRGDPRNYDYWAQELGCEGWSYDEVLPFFKKSEDFHRDAPAAADGASRGRGGPLKVTHMRDGTFPTKDVSQRFVDAAGAVGLANIEDYNGPVQSGASLSQITIRNGHRSDTATAFLYETGAIKRPNLTVLTGHMATRLLFRGKDVYGVALRNGAARKPNGSVPPELLVHARREVVLSAGAVGTPWLLLLSGVGPAEHLREKGISVVADMPGVGRNLQDHLFFPVNYAMKPGVHNGFSDKRPLDVARTLASYALSGTGFAAYSAVSAMAFAHSGVTEEKRGNDLQLHLLPISGSDQDQYEKNLGFIKSPDRPLRDLSRFPASGITGLPGLVLPRSRGVVELRSADPEDHPIIDPRYLEAVEDLDMLVEAFRLFRKMAQAGPLAEVLGDETVDPSIPHPPESAEYMKEYIRRTIITIYHPVGTAKMGPASDPQAVVDLKLCLHGFSGLRIADASVMPMVPSGNTNAPSIMVGERAAHFIKEQHGLR